MMMMEVRCSLVPYQVSTLSRLVPGSVGEQDRLCADPPVMPKTEMTKACLSIFRDDVRRHDRTQSEL